MLRPIPSTPRLRPKQHHIPYIVHIYIWNRVLFGTHSCSRQKEQLLEKHLINVTWDSEQLSLLLLSVTWFTAGQIVFSLEVEKCQTSQLCVCWLGLVHSSGARPWKLYVKAIHAGRETWRNVKYYCIVIENVNRIENTFSSPLHVDALN